jgi:hypothetical protein
VLFFAQKLRNSIMAVKTQGTEVFVILPTVADPLVNEILKISCPTGLNLGSDTRSDIPTTCLDSTESETSTPGLSKPGSASMPIDADPKKAAHVRLKALEESGATVNWASGWSDGVAPPTLNVDGVSFVLPTTRSWNTFSGYVSDFPFDIGLNSVVKSAVTIMRTSKVKWIPKPVV